LLWAQTCCKHYKDNQEALLQTTQKMALEVGAQKNQTYIQQGRIINSSKIWQQVKGKVVPMRN